MRKQYSLSLAYGLLLIAATASADRIPAGDVRSLRIESPHPYPSGTLHRPVVWKDYVSSGGATFVRLHFSHIGLAAGDYLTVARPGGGVFWTYAGTSTTETDVWAFAVPGDTAIVELHAGNTSGGYGYHIDQVGHGSVSLSAIPEVVCGSDGREDVACHPEVDALQKPVARLLFTSGGSQFLCTGWLVTGSKADTMVTNNHCFSSQSETNTVQALFNFQFTTCGGSVDAATSSYAGGSFLKTNSVTYSRRKGGLDYTLFTLKGSPSATWGKLTPTTKAATVGEHIYLIQHPGGNEKRIGYWEDASHTVRCKVDTINKTYSTSAPSSQTGYGCDSEGGASGSPILDATTGHVIGLHHFGGVGNNPCLNSGIQLSKICGDAGSLLTCALN